MGDIADMILEGLLDEETGEYIGEENLEKYGTETPGFPVSLERERREKSKRKKKSTKRKQKCQVENQRG